MNTEQLFNTMEEVKAYGYVRRSKDEDETGESIDLQSRVVESHCETIDISLIDIIKDNNISGYKFQERQGLNQLVRLIEDGKCNVVIAKDLSRLGRHQAKTLLLLDFFKDHNVRLILVNDSYDSEKENDDSYLGIKSWFNEMYIKDISKKTKTQLYEIQKKEGLVALPPYGYKKIIDDNGDTIIVLDEEAAPIVRKIFDLYLSGLGIKAISIHLTNKGVLSPRNQINKVHKVRAPKVPIDNVWHHSTVRRILKNDAYYGRLINRKSIRTKINKTATENVSEENRIIHDNFFPEIVEHHEFLRVQSLLVDRRVKNYRKGSGNPHLFTGIVVCRDCGKNLIFKNRSGKSQYFCSRYHKLGRDYCTPHTIQEEILIDIVFDELNVLLENAKINYDKLDKEIARRKKSQYNYEHTIEDLRDKLLSLEKKIEYYLEEKFAERISEQMANKFIEKANQEYNIVTEQIKDVLRTKENNDLTTNDLSKSVDVIQIVLDSKQLNRQIIDLMIDKIIVHEDKDQVSQGTKVLKDINIVWKTPFMFHKRTSSF